MRMYRCDRCGREFGSLKGIFFSSYVFSIQKYIDLCPECTKSFKRWLKGKEEEEEQE